ncbi:hypothetical protein BV882_04510 [Streptomyces sp. 46]|nr:hypothetical protein BV882_04510 [Streptomyces sp. 46]
MEFVLVPSSPGAGVTRLTTVVNSIPSVLISASGVLSEVGPPVGGLSAGFVTGIFICVGFTLVRGRLPHTGDGESPGLEWTRCA